MNDTRETAEPAAKLQHILARGAKDGWFARLRGVFIVIALLVVAGAIYLKLHAGDDAAQPRYKTEAVTRGTLVVEVSATGNLQPTNMVDVGSELSGIVDTLHVDENDSVQKGQVLARLDLARLKDAVTKSRANLASADAQVLQAAATVAEVRARLDRMKRVAELSGGKVPSKSEMDSAEADHKRAMANETSARAAVAQARATLQSDETNLGKAHIRSPIDGVVLARKIQVGQTVAASFQAPVLFTLAEDLAKMELQVNVDEADVGQVKVGQKAVFSVDAWPGRAYTAVITRVGYGSQVTDGVVSYLTILEVDNTDLSLRPGMTGNAEITTLSRENVLLVPNAALRYTPVVTPVAQAKSGGNVMSMLMPRPARTTPRAPTRLAPGDQRLWLLRDGEPVPLDVRTGATNGRVTEIVSGDIEPGMAVITEAAAARP
jgi:HlyD family secretion protein